PPMTIEDKIHHRSLPPHTVCHHLGRPSRPLKGSSIGLRSGNDSANRGGGIVDCRDVRAGRHLQGHPAHCGDKFIAIAAGGLTATPSRSSAWTPSFSIYEPYAFRDRCIRDGTGNCPKLRLRPATR